MTTGIIALILLSWSVVNVWASWGLILTIRKLDTERRALRRWARLTVIRDKQQRNWN
jgi:hypothetical protein